MKLVYPTGALLLTLSIQTSAADLSRCLEEQMANLEEGAYLCVNVRLTDQLDVSRLRPYLAGLTKMERRSLVSRAAREVAWNTQEVVRAFLAPFEEDGRVMDIRGHWICNEMNMLAQKEVIDRLALHPAVAYLGWNPDLPEVEVADRAAPDPAPPAEPQAEQWNLEMIDAPLAWAMGFEGQGVIIGNVDTGVDRYHPDYAPRLWDNVDEVANGLDDDGNGFVDDTWGWNFDSNNNNPGYSTSSHGTNTTGIMVGDGTGGTRTGVAPRGTVMAVRSCSNEYDARDAYQYVLDNGADVLSSSCSYKYPNCPDYAAFRQMGELEAAAGLFHTNSIGNQRGWGSYPVPYNISAPAHAPGAFLHPDQGSGGLSGVHGCGAVDSGGRYKSYSGQGPSEYEAGQPTCRPQYDYDDYPYPSHGCIKPDYAAPTDVRTTRPGGGYTSGFGGTSAATPHSGGAAAVILSAVPDATPEQVSEALQLTADDRGPTGKDNDYGAGIIDVDNAVNYLLKDMTVALVPPVNKVNRGGNMTFDVELYNNTASPRTFTAYGNLYLPDGSPYPGNPVIQPVTATLAGGQNIVRTMTATVNASPGQYTLEAVVEVGGTTLTSDTFVFAVLD